MADTWHVVSQVQDTEISETGPGFNTVWNVTYQVDSGPAKGTRGTVKIPLDEYSAETVGAAIANAVYHLDQVAKL